MCASKTFLKMLCQSNAEGRAAVPLGETLISEYLVIFHPENTEVVVLQDRAAFFCHAQAKHHNGIT